MSYSSLKNSSGNFISLAIDAPQICNIGDNADLIYNEERRTMPLKLFICLPNCHNTVYIVVQHKNVCIYSYCMVLRKCGRLRKNSKYQKIN